MNLRSELNFNDIGGAAYLTRLVTLTPTAYNAAAYGRMIEEAATRRRLIIAAGDIAKLAYETGTDINTVVGESDKALFAVSERRSAQQVFPANDVMSACYDQVKFLYDHRDEMLGVPTGFTDLDRLLGGMQPSDLLVAARPGRGKTSFVISVVLHAIKMAHKRAAVFSLEMSNGQLAYDSLPRRQALTRNDYAWAKLGRR